jgi:hypothetical protein
VRGLAGDARAQTVGDEIVLPAGSFAKDFGGIVKESGGYGGTGVQHGTLKFPRTSGLRHRTVSWSASRLSCRRPWVGHDVDIVFGGSTGGLMSAQFRIIGELDNTPSVSPRSWAPRTGARPT